GDVLALCIRHGASSPSAATPSPYSGRKDLLLAAHAHALLEEGRQALRRIPGGHRSETAEYALLPESERAIVALGHVSAYSVRGEAVIPQALLDLYDRSAIRDAPCWFSEKAGINQNAQ
ncbi:hypothetical protein EDB89DRAFT_1833040, partial [Lactarius sanguifluus]